MSQDKLLNDDGLTYFTIAGESFTAKQVVSVLTSIFLDKKLVDPEITVISKNKENQAFFSGEKNKWCLIIIPKEFGWDFTEKTDSEPKLLLVSGILHSRKKYFSPEDEEMLPILKDHFFDSCASKEVSKETGPQGRISNNVFTITGRMQPYPFDFYLFGDANNDKIQKIAEKNGEWK